jgi:hypothetical protein
MERLLSCLTLCFVLIAVLVLGPVNAAAQRKPTHARVQLICNYRRAGISTPRALKFSSVTEAEAAVDRILKVAGLTRNFVIEPSDDVDNAESGIDGNNHRYIYYNPSFMSLIKNMARTDWAALSIFAHEVGHHLLGHRTEDEGRTPQEERENRYRQELEADKYSGFILRYLGASIQEAQSAVAAYGDENGSSTHPARKARLDAIDAGWEDANAVIKSLVVTESGRGAPVTSRQTSALPQNPTTANETPQLSVDNTSARLSEDRWAWTVFINAEAQVLDQVNCVVYQLHPTFRPSVVRVCERGAGPPFALKANGWGAFTIQVHVIMKDRRQYDLSHALKL